MDKLLKSLIFDNQLSLSVLETTEMINEAIKIHKLSPLSAAALGRTLTVSTFMASGLKNEQDALSVTVSGDGIGGKITVCGNGKLDMRGSIENPFTELPLKPDGHLDVGGCVGKHGRITVVKNMGLKEPYSGSSELVSGEIAQDFTAYYFYSEQQPSAISLGVLIGKDLSCESAGGVIIQTLPNASNEAVDYAEKLMRDLPSASTLIKDLGAEGVMKKYFNGVKYQTYYPKYRCLCSREYIEKILISLGKKELLDIIQKEGKVKVTCEFCEKEYRFDISDVEGLFGK